MALDSSAIGLPLPETELEVERGRLRLFCTAVGETDPVYLDVATARAAGHPDLPVPPTFFCAIQHEHPEPFAWLVKLGVDPARMLHGEQSFTYHAMAYAGDRLRLRAHISDIFTKKNGTLDFIVRDAEVTRDDGQTIAKLRDVIVIPQREQTP